MAPSNTGYDLGAAFVTWQNIWANSTYKMGGTTVIDAARNGFFNNVTTAGTTTLSGITGSTQCLQVNSSGVVSGVGAGCGVGSFLPLSGGTMTGSILGNTTNNIGSSSAYFVNATFSGQVTAATTRMIYGPPSGLFDYFDWVVTTNILDLKNSSNQIVFRVDRINKAFTMDGHVWPNTDNTYDLGTSGFPAWRNLYLKTALIMGGTTVIDSSRNGSFAAITATSVGNFSVGSGNFYLRTFSGAPSCAGVSNGWAGYDTTGNVLYICSGGIARAH
jgi:hypothetical protein